MSSLNLQYIGTVEEGCFIKNISRIYNTATGQVISVVKYYDHIGEEVPSDDPRLQNLQPCSPILDVQDWVSTTSELPVYREMKHLDGSSTWYDINEDGTVTKIDNRPSDLKLKICGCGGSQDDLCRFSKEYPSAKTWLLDVSGFKENDAAQVSMSFLNESGADDDNNDNRSIERTGDVYIVSHLISQGGTIQVQIDGCGGLKEPSEFMRLVTVDGNFAKGHLLNIQLPFTDMKYRLNSGGWIDVVNDKRGVSEGADITLAELPLSPNSGTTLEIQYQHSGSTDIHYSNILTI